LPQKWDNYFQYSWNPSQNTPENQLLFPFGHVFYGFLYSGIPQVFLMEKDNKYIIRSLGANLGSRNPRGWHKKTPSFPPPP
jgi:hypothetical protein